MISQKLRTLKTLSRQTILEHSKYLTVENHTVEFPNNRIISDWAWIVTPDTVIIIPVTEDKEFLCFRQVKYGIKGSSLALVGGYIEPGESPLTAARRELLEETGYATAEWIDLGSYCVDPNRGVATTHIFLAKNARHITAPNSDDMEDQQLHLLNQSEIETALENSEFKALCWAAGVGLALNYMRRKSG